MPLLAAEHPQRRALAGEVHARPSEALATPSRASYVAVLVDPTERGAESAHLAALCASFEVAPPGPGVNHFSTRLGALAVKWERHGEFSGYTFTAPGQNPTPFSEPPATLLPAGWLVAVPGQVIVAAHAVLIAAKADGADAALVGRHFGADAVVLGGIVGDGAGVAYTDFRIHDDGYSRFLLLDAGFTPRQAGRMLQRLFEIEAYRTLALLALPIARRQSAELIAVEGALAEVTAEIAAGKATDISDDEALLHKLTRLAAEVESELAASQFRFGACRAYAELVTTRIAEMREGRLAGVQPIAEFMARRFAPAVATCATASQRLHGLSERVARASALLSTRVDIARERQNQALLGSMDRRARLQLRLQETVEGLSVAAIVYYAAGLVGYVAKGLKSGGVPVEPDLLIGAAIPLLLGVVIVATRRARRRLREGDASGGRPGRDDGAKHL